MDESILPFIDVDEGRLDISEDVRHFSPVDVSGDLPRFFSVKDQVVELTKLEIGISDFFRFNVE